MMETSLNYTIWILILPFAAFVLNGLLSKRLPNQVASAISIISILIAAALSYYLAFVYFTDIGKAAETFMAIKAFDQTWLRFTESLQIKIGFLVDPISIMMLIVVTTVSSLVFIYSIGYMKGEKGYNRFFAFLSLFSFSMMGLVVATNLFQMYIFWELVGVSSFLLIGYYYDKPSAVSASKKAFIVTRFADLGFLLGILLLSYYGNSFDFLEISSDNGAAVSQMGGITFMGMSVLSWALLLVFTGGAGKSAMFPLHIWLPDAMEGPTPVSALIHAATMVVAGVYLVARMFTVYSFGAPDVLEIVAIIGAFSALFAAVIACTQFDIKRVLAFSTMSQIGYMMMALGVSGYAAEGLGFTASMFHLFTHAFFKALLFLGAGAIIHSVHTNDIREMGGLRKYLPISHITFLIACLAISGIPPFAGFFSKDEILAAAQMHGMIYFGVGYLVAGLTAFYMFRLYFMVFWNKNQPAESKVHESPSVMTIPLIILALGSIFAGFVPFGNLITTNGQVLETEFHVSLAAATVGIALVGIVVSYLFYAKPSDRPERIAKSLGGFYRTVYQKFYFDEIYLFITQRIIFGIFSAFIAWFDRNIVDGTINAIGWLTAWISSRIKGLQSGQVQQYAYVFLGGVLIIGLVFFYYWMR